VRTFGKAFVVVAALGAVAGVANARHGNDDRVVVDRGRYEKAVNQLLKDIEELEDRNENNANKEDRKWTRERLGAMRQDLTGIRADLQDAPPAAPGMPPPPSNFPPPPPQPAEPMAMSPQQFTDFVGELKKQSFDRERLGLLKEVASQNWFTTDQVIQSMALFSFSSEKIAAGTAMYPHVVDRGNWYKVYSTFSFSSDQEKLRKQTSGK
jgi:hypothetical protein